MTLTERYDADICLAQWMKKMEQIRDGKRTYQPPPPVTKIRSIKDIFLNKSHPWGYDKLGNTNLFDLFGAAKTEYLYTWEGHKVKFNAN